MRIARLVSLVIAVFAAGAIACGSQESPAPAEKPMAKPTEPAAAAPAPEPAAPAGPDRAALREQGLRVFSMLEPEAASETNPVTEEKIELGRALYYDPRLSKNQDISCNSCHQLDNFGVDSEATSPGHKGQRGDRNSPTVYNAGFHVAQFWDGRAADLEAQAKGPVLNPVEMAMADEATVVAVLKSVPGYAPLFAAAFPGEADPISYDNMAGAIGAFERRLVTADRFDAFLEGDDEALTDDEVAGLAKFMSAGCITCHNGATIGGLQYQKLGLVKPYETEDVGRMKVTGNEAEMYVFKVPSLRNIAETGPYFHDGSIVELDQAISLMGEHQLGKTLSPEEVASLRAFLEALTGTVDTAYVAEPELPESGPDTPAPDPS